MVLLHTSWKFNGLAGVLVLMTFIVVVSGFIGRYIFTAIPRSADGIALEAEQINATITEINQHLQDLSRTNSKLFDQMKMKLDILLQSGDFRKQIKELRILAKRSNPTQQKEIRKLMKVLQRKHTLNKQVASLANTRRLLSLWHTFHIPIGVALFIVAFIHIGAALYYSTFLK